VDQEHETQVEIEGEECLVSGSHWTEPPGVRSNQKEGTKGCISTGNKPLNSWATNTIFRILKDEKTHGKDVEE
jgi:hypothetical protein